MRLFINSTSKTGSFMLEQSSFDSVMRLKQQISNREKIDVEDQFLQYGCKPLDDSKTLDFYGIRENTTIQLQMRIRGGMDKVKEKDPESKSIFKRNNKVHDENVSKEKTMVKKNDLLPEGYNSIDELKKTFEKDKETGFYKITQEPESSFFLQMINMSNFAKISATNISKDLKYYIIASENSIKVFGLDSKRPLCEFIDSTSRKITCVATSNDSKYLVSFGELNFKMYNMETNTLIYQRNHLQQGEVTCATMTNDNKYLIYGSSRDSVKIFNLEDQVLTADFAGLHPNGVSCISVTNDSRSIISGSSNGVIKVLDFQTGVLLHEFQFAHNGNIGCLGVTDDNKYLFSAGSEKFMIKVFDLEAKVLVHSFELDCLGSKCSMVVTDDLKYIISLDFSNSIKIACFEKKFHVHRFSESHESQSKILILACQSYVCQVTCLAMSDDNAFLVTGSRKGSIKVFDMKTKKLVHNFEDAHESEIKSLVLTKNSQYLISGSADWSIKIFDIEKKVLVHSFIDINEGGTTGVAMTKDNKSIISGGAFGSISIHDFETKELVYSLSQTHHERISCLVLANNDKHVIAAGSIEKKIQIFDIETKSLIYNIPYFHQNKITCMKITSDEKYIITGSTDKSIKVFDLEAKTLVHHFQDAHKGDVVCLALTTDNRYVVSKGSCQMKVFDLMTGRQMAVINIEDTCGSPFVLTNDNKYIITGTDHEMDIIRMPFVSQKDILFTSERVPAASNLYGRLNGLLTNFSDQNVFTIYQDFVVMPYNWTLLHLAAIFHPFTLSKILTHPDFKSIFWVDRYNKTPLHYLFAHDRVDYNSANLVLRKMITYLEEEETTPFSHRLVCDSLSGILPVMMEKLNPKIISQFLKNCYIPTPSQYGQTLPEFGQDVKRCMFTKLPSMKPEVQRKIHGEGNNQIAFRSVLLNLDYDPKSQDVLKNVSTLYDVKDEEVFQSQAIANLINHLWDQTFPYMAGMAIAFSLYMSLISIYLGLGQRILAVEIVILAFTCIFLLFEFVQIATLRLKYFASVWNHVDLVHLILVVALIISNFAESDNELALKWVSSVIIFLGFWRWASYLRLFAPTRNLIEIIVSTLRDMMGFVLILIFITIGFTLIFLEFNQDSGFDQHLFDTFKLLYATFDDSNYDLSQKLILAFILFILNIVLLNLLISIMGDSYDKAQEKRVLTDSQTRLEMIQEIVILLKTFGRKKTKGKGYLIVCGPSQANETEEDAVSLEWDGRVNVIKRMLKQTEVKTQQEMKKEVGRIEQQITDVKQEVKALEQLVLNNHQEMMKTIKGLVNGNK